MTSFLLALVVSRSCTKNVRPDRFNKYFFLLLYFLCCSSKLASEQAAASDVGGRSIQRKRCFSVDFRKSRLNRRKLPYGIFTISLYCIVFLISIILFYPPSHHPPPTTQFDQCFSSSFNLLLVQCVCVAYAIVINSPTFTSCNTAFQNLKIIFFAVGYVS